MNPKPAKSNSINHSSRCRHRFANGMRCRLPASDANSFCASHAKLSENVREPADLAATLTAGLTEFTSASHINDFLARLLLLLAQNRISPRRAAVLAYITNQLLHTLPAIEREATAADPKNKPPVIIWDMPRPAHERSGT
jgi:hypothetical protein